MRIIISPAKKMNENTDSLAWRELPPFLAKTEELLDRIKEMSCEEQKALWKCNDEIAALNRRRFQEMDLRSRLTPAILAYEGIQYQYMAPDVFTETALGYIEEHLRILSGFYGILKPFDGVTPYRLEMQAKLSVSGFSNLYAFWGSGLADTLASETNCIINLASGEYSKCIERYLPNHVKFITCVFGEENGGKIIEKGTMCKMARGEMVRFLAEHEIEDTDGLKDFHSLGYQYEPAHSNERTFVYVKQ